MLDVSDRAYWLVTLAVMLTSIVLWAAHIHEVYSAIIDDFTVYYSTAIGTVNDWRAPFLHPFNFAHPYYFLISYLPIISGLSLDSNPVPIVGERVGAYQFFLLCLSIYHAMLLGVWAWLRKCFARIAWRH